MKTTEGWVLSSFGYDNLKWSEIPLKDLSDDEVLVKVLAIGVCFRDTIDITGAYPFMRFPTVPGHEMCGEVVAAGNNVPFKPGDIVISMHGASCGKCNECLRGIDHWRHCLQPQGFMWEIPGTYSKYMVAPWRGFLKVPLSIREKFSPEELSFVYCVAGTAYRAIFTRGGIKPGDFLLITGAGGGVGLHAVQMGAAAGARVIAVSSSPQKKKLLEKLGAEWVVGFADGKFNKEVRTIAGNEGVHVCIENTGSIGMEGALRSLRKNGRLVVVGNLRVDKYSLNPGFAILNEITITGSMGASTRDMDAVFNLMEKGALKPILHKTFALKDMMEAHNYLREKRPAGRLVLLP